MATWPTITDDDGSGTTGTVLDNANTWTPIKTYIGGASTTPSFNAGDFTSSGTWTVGAGDVGVYKYIVCGKQMTVWWVISTTTVAGGPTDLRIAIPGGATLAGSVRGIHWYSDNGTEGIGGVIVTSTYIALYKAASGTSWAASTNNTNTYGQVSFEIA